MAFITKLFGRSKTKTAEVETAAPPCPHVTLVPHWDSAEDIGKQDKATSFICDACDQSFTPQEARQLRSTESDRLAQVIETETSEESDSNPST
jgi:hypothetical protein